MDPFFKYLQFKDVPPTRDHRSTVLIGAGDYFHSDIKDEKCPFKGALGKAVTAASSRLNRRLQESSSSLKQLQVRSQSPQVYSAVNLMSVGFLSRPAELQQTDDNLTPFYFMCLTKRNELCHTNVSQTD